MKLNITASTHKARICGNKKEHAKKDGLTVERINGTENTQGPHGSPFH